MFGIELTSAAVEEAKLNAERNGITNCVFVSGKSEDRLLELIEQIDEGNRKIVAIVDPGKSRLGMRLPFCP